MQTSNDVKDGHAELDLTQDGTADTMVGVDVNAGEQIVKENLLIDSKTYNSLSPNMKDALKMSFRFMKKRKVTL